MELAKALGLSGGETVAFVGAGGKTSAMFALAKELNPPIVLTTTTHLGAWQAALADDHQVIRSVKDIQSLNFNKNILLLTGPVGDDERLAGLQDDVLAALHSRCQEAQITLLIEADGARQRSIKAPASFEPNLPAFDVHVVVMAGLTALGKPLDAKSVHRPELFSSLSGLPMENPITIDHLAAVLRSDRGGLKGIRQGSERILFLNQADSDILMALGGRLARRLVDVYDRVLVGSLQEPGQQGTIFSAHGRTAGIILAAGGSERLGRPKQLLDWGGQPFIVRVVINALEAGLDPLTVVTGAEHALVIEALGDLPVQFVYNADWADGQSSSMLAGLAALQAPCDSVIFLLSDQPQVSPLLIRQLMERFAETRTPIIAPMAGGQRGNPVLFGRETFDALTAVEGDQGGRAVFHKFEVDWQPWVDSRVLMDVDLEEDLLKLRQAYFPDG